MKQYQLTQKLLNLKAGEIFLQMSDGSYKNSTQTMTLSGSTVEESDSFKRLEDINLWRPSQENEIFYTISPDGGILELAWSESRFIRMFQFGNVFRDRSQGEEVASAMAVLLQTYQKKHSEYNSKHKIEPKIFQQTEQQATPPIVPVNPNIPPPNIPPPAPMQRPGISPDDPRLSPAGVGNLFRNSPQG